MNIEMRSREKRGEKSEENMKREATRLKTTGQTKDKTQEQEKKHTEWKEERKIDGESRGEL